MAAPPILYKRRQKCCAARCTGLQQLPLDDPPDLLRECRHFEHPHPQQLPEPQHGRHRPESCKNVNIIGNHVHVGDDCIALKSSKLFLGMKLHIPCENVIIRNCCLSRGHGGLVIGSEMSGGIKNVTVTQCLMDHTDRGLRVKTRRGRGKYAVIDGLAFRNVVMDGVLTPFVINMFYFLRPGRPHRLCMRPMVPARGRYDPDPRQAGDGAYRGHRCPVCRLLVQRLPEQPIEGVTMRDVKISFAPDARPGQAAMMCGAGASCKGRHPCRECAQDCTAQCRN